MDAVIGLLSVFLCGAFTGYWIGLASRKSDRLVSELVDRSARDAIKSVIYSADSRGFKFHTGLPAYSNVVRVGVPLSASAMAHISCFAPELITKDTNAGAEEVEDGL